MKKTLKLIPAIVMLLVSAILVSTSTYAWFSMNNKVTVTGMKVQTKVSSNLFVAEGGVVTNKTLADEANFDSSLLQTKKGILEPASTVDGVNFQYTVDAATDGSHTGSSAYYAYVSGQAASSASFQDKFSEVYGVTKSSATGMDFTGAVPYIDYVIQLKAQNPDADAKALKLTQLDLEYDNKTNEVDETQRAFRVAIFVEKVTGRTDFTATDVGELVAIYPVTGATNFSAGEAINSSGTRSAVGPATTKNIDDAVATGTFYYKVVVRLYLEGEDNTCNNDTFMTLLGDWSLNLGFELGTETAAVTAVTKTVAP